MIREQVESWPYEVIEQCIKDYEQFEKDGYIGDCLLRSKAQSFELPINVSVLMKDIAFECYREKSILLEIYCL